MPRPVIGFLTDFGLDSAAAICRAVILSIANDAQIVDITHGVRKFAIRDGAYLLRAALDWFPVGVHLAVVDPGVGTDRLAVALRTGRGDLLVGPDNGLLLPAAERLGGILEARSLENPELMLPRTSSTFHGRDVFAPMTAHLATGTPFEAIGPTVPLDRLVQLRFPAPIVTPGSLVTEAVYVDSFGNVRLSARPDDLRSAFEDLDVDPSLCVELPRTSAAAPGEIARVRWVRTFGETEPGSPLLYADSSGDLALGINQGDAAARYGISSGERVVIRGS